VPRLQRLRAWRRHHRQSAADSLARVFHQPLSSLLTFLVIGVALALPSGLWLSLENLSTLGGALDRPVSLSLFLADAAGEDEARGLAKDLAGRGDVDGVNFISREAALEEFVTHSGLGDLVASLPDNPLPQVLVVRPVSEDPARIEELEAVLAALPLVEEVLVDTRWLQRLQSIMALARRAVQFLAALLVAAVVLVVGNTIRLTIESRRDEVVITKLVGGSNAFVRRPMLYTGLWYGFGGGLVAAALVALGIALLRPPVDALARAYDSRFELMGLSLVDSLQLALFGAALGLAGAWLAAARHLRDIEPD
jgi:cell division transport system permease protein